MAMLAEQWGMGGSMMPGSMMQPGAGGAAWDAQTGLGMSPHGGSTPFGSNMSQSSMVAMELKRMFLELGPEEQRLWRVGELMMRASPSDATACIPLILNKLVTFASAHTVGIHALSELLRIHPMVVSQNIGPNCIYDLFNPQVEDGPAATFLYNLLCCKSNNGGNINQECNKIQKLLMRRSKTQDLRKVHGCRLRSCLCQVWVDFPPTRPDRQLVVQCCARWLADARTPLAEKVPCLTLLQQELEMRSSSEGDVLLVSLLLEQVCRDPVGHSPDIQQLLWLRNDTPSPTVLKPIVCGLAEETGRLVTLWICLCLWPPQAGPDFVHPRSPAPIHSFLRSMLVVFSQFANSDELCRTCLLSLAGVAASGNGSWSNTAAAASDLLLILHRDGPLLSRGVWLPVATILQGHGLASQFESVAQLMARLGDLSGASPHQYGSALGSQGAMQMAQANAYPQGNMHPQGLRGGYSQAAPQIGGNPLQMQQAVEPPPEPGKMCYAPSPPRIGLRNINNTCYMNTVVQSLFMTNSFLHDLYNFKLHLKNNPSVVDKEDYEMGKHIVKKMQRHMAKMLLTRHPHTDIEQMLNVFPETYRNGEQQDVTECVRFLFDKLGGSEQQLIRDTFAGELRENTQCQICGNTRNRPETFTDMVISVPAEDVVMQSGRIPILQELFDARFQFELMTDDNLLHCEQCQRKTKCGKWTEISSPPKHICICLNRFTYNVKKQDFIKEKTPINIAGNLHIGPFQYELYFVIIHTGKDATSGHYYAVGSRAETTQEERQIGQKQWFQMDDSKLTPADPSIFGILQGTSDKKDDNPYALFYRCQQAPPTPMVRLPQALIDDVLQEDAQIVLS